MIVPHAMSGESATMKCGAFDVAEPPDAMFGHVAEASRITTPGVDDESVPETFVNPPYNASIVTGTCTCSPGSHTPFASPAPPGQASTLPDDA
jgi:hypothetical protein